ncbi:TlpA disulfide reductase family protein [Parabacteroides sp. ZJ-118]|uniref:TlpA disulfide reductase family protein n=1 Tax=Parabacteroides sp. ZJ-118 TaxID=2709398 RepID=UPI0013E9D14F|nr:TlpA disulfide reductase family protein [Parabacteroides sp. ZJ-118]
MKKYLTLAASALLLAACGEKPGYEINGTVADSGLNGKYVYLYEYGVQGAAPMDSALVQNNAFTFKGTQDAPALRKLAFAEDVVKPKRAASGENAPFTSIFVLENGNLQATLDETASAVSGTPENDGLKALQAHMRTLRADLEKLSADMKSEDKEVASAAEKQYDEIDQKVTNAVRTYILDHTTQLSAAKLLYDFRYSLDEASQHEIIAKADSVFKAAPNIDKLMAHLEVLTTVAVGKKFTDFEMADPDGKTRKLSEFVGNGKDIVLIDFWASWCSPCRRDMPNLVAAYKKYKHKGFEIVGISLDNKADAWKKGIKDLHITWAQLSDLQGWKNAGAQRYGVNSIPHTVLVDKDGTIIAKNLRGEGLEAKLQELFGN